MNESIVMTELRKIKDANSLRYLSQTPEEHKKEMQESLDWFTKALGKPVRIVQPVNMDKVKKG